MDKHMNYIENEERLGIESLDDRLTNRRVDLRSKLFSASYQCLYQSPYSGGVS